MASLTHPAARREGLVVQPLDGELLVVDGEITHVLNPVAARVYKSCDGHHSVAAISKQLALDEVTVVYALQQLERRGLLFSNATGMIQQKPITRREFLKQGALATVAIPVIKTIQLPSPQTAASCPPCETGDDCIKIGAGNICEFGCCCGACG